MDFLSIEVWDSAGRVGNLQCDATVKWSIFSPSIASLSVPLTHNLAPVLFDTSGKVKIVAFYNSAVFVGVVSAVSAEGKGAEAGVLHATAVGGRGILDRVLVPPGLAHIDHGEMEAVRLEGQAEPLVKRLVNSCLDRVRLPVHVFPVRREGPKSSVATDWQTCSEAVDEVLAGTGYFLSVEGWVPGMRNPLEKELTELTTIVDVRPLIVRDDLVWAPEQLGTWKVRRVRQGSSHLVVEAKDPADNKPLRVVVERQQIPRTESWVLKETYVSAPDFLKSTQVSREKVEKMRDFGDAKLAHDAESWSVEVDLTHPVREFATEHGFSIGDVGKVHLPVIGDVALAVVEVEVSQKEGSTTVKPILATLTDNAPRLVEVL